MARRVLTSLHGREIGLGDAGELLVRSGIIRTIDGSAVSFPDGITGSSSTALTVTSKSTAYTLTLLDAGTTLYHPASDTTARTWAIPANSSVAFDVGTVLTFVNDPSAGAITLTCGDTIWLAGSVTTGTRTIAAGGVATAMKMTSTKWVISGAGVT